MIFEFESSISACNSGEGKGWGRERRGEGMGMIFTSKNPLTIQFVVNANNLYENVYTIKLVRCSKIISCYCSKEHKQRPTKVC